MHADLQKPYVLEKYRWKLVQQLQLQPFVAIAYEIAVEQSKLMEYERRVQNVADSVAVFDLWYTLWSVE